MFSLLALAIFIKNGIVHYVFGIILFAGMILGGYIGAHTAIKKGDSWVKVIFAIIIAASSAKLILFS